MHKVLSMYLGGAVFGMICLFVENTMKKISKL